MPQKKAEGQIRLEIVQTICSGGCIPQLVQMVAGAFYGAPHAAG
jgi:hypothetical protein